MNQEHVAPTDARVQEDSIISEIEETSWIDVVS